MKIIESEADKAQLVSRYGDMYNALVSTNKQLGMVLAARLELFKRDGNEKPLIDAFYAMVEAVQKSHEAMLRLQGKAQAASRSADMGDMINDMKRAFGETRQIVEGTGHET